MRSASQYSRGNRSWRAARDPPTLSLPFMRTMRFFVYEIPMSQPFASTRFFMAFTPRLVRRLKGRFAMANMDEGSKGSKRSVLAFGIVATISIVLLVVIGVAGENVGPNTPQAKVESPYLR
jgi:hypothetical protein